MHYQIKYTEEAKRALPMLPGNYRQRIRREIEALAENLRPPQAKLMRGSPPDRYRIRLDKWRLIYRVLDEEQTIRILRVRIKTGQEIYQDLDE